MGYTFSLILNREITEDESIALTEARSVAATVGSDTLPTDPSVPVTKLEFDDDVSPSLEQAIESALRAVQAVPGLDVPALTVPPQPAGPPKIIEAESPVES
jgi:hypothetical protein